VCSAATNVLSPLISTFLHDRYSNSLVLNLNVVVLVVAARELVATALSPHVVAASIHRQENSVPCQVLGGDSVVQCCCVHDSGSHGVYPSRAQPKYVVDLESFFGKLCTPVKMLNDGDHSRDVSVVTWFEMWLGCGQPMRPVDSLLR
jgi:hypothetical protein